jgi:beta-galactosidase
VLPHWNWPGKEGQEIDVKCFGNCQEIELFLNGKSLGRKTVETNGHLEWRVTYEPGTLLARGYNDGREIITDKVETTGEPAAIQLTPDRAILKADGGDVSVITIQVNDAQGRMVPVAGNEITFGIQGPGKIIGVGNGDPSSHEPDKYFEQVSSVPVGNWHRQVVGGVENRPEVAFDFDDSGWQTAFAGRDGENRGGGNTARSSTNVYRGTFELPAGPNATVSLLVHDLGESEWVYLNGKMVAENVQRSPTGHEFKLAPDLFRTDTNVLAIIATPREERNRGEGNRNAGSPAVVKIVTPPGEWKRSVFNGLAQVIVQSSRKSGEIKLTARAEHLSPATVALRSQAVDPQPSVP